MTRFTCALIAAGSMVTFSVAMTVSSDFYWTGTATKARGEYFLFGTPIPLILGGLLWLVIKPALVLSVAVTGWACYHYFRMITAPRLGLCENCGYDLRATPERCPECGRAVRGAGSP